MTSPYHIIRFVAHHSKIRSRLAAMNDRRVLNGIFWVLRFGAPWWTFLVRAPQLQSLCSLSGVWGKIMNALPGAHDVAMPMIDTSVVRVHQHVACITRNRWMG
jgi:transposase